MTSSSRLPIRRVNRSGGVDELGFYEPASKSLDLAAPGFPLLGPGVHVHDGDLPWVFDEMAPSGFLARRFARWFPELRLREDRQLWRADELLQAISRRGHDLPGNLLVGDESFERYQKIFVDDRSPGPPPSSARREYPRFVRDILEEDCAKSSVGGERPKFSLRLSDGSARMVKFTPPLSSPFGQRWADLLRLEAHCSATLRSFGLPAVSSEYVEISDRGYLEIERFDRSSGGGRMGCVTLYWLGAALYSEIESAVTVVDALIRDGFLAQDATRTVRMAAAFSARTGNTDAHLGNYALTIGDDGAAALAPLYDVLPMALAPRSDELPDRYLKVIDGRPEPAVAPLVERLVDRVERDPLVSRAFKDTWRNLVGY